MTLNSHGICTIPPAFSQCFDFAHVPQKSQSEPDAEQWRNSHQLWGNKACFFGGGGETENGCSIARTAVHCFPVGLHKSLWTLTIKQLVWGGMDVDITVELSKLLEKCPWKKYWQINHLLVWVAEKETTSFFLKQSDPACSPSFCFHPEWYLCHSHGSSRLTTNKSLLLSELFLSLLANNQANL